jgi:hypothetical protein
MPGTFMRGPPPRRRDHEPLIRVITVDKFRPNYEEALRTLDEVASRVQPLMRDRGWRVGLLAEFWPRDHPTYMLGKNTPSSDLDEQPTIQLRLR